MLPIFGTVGKNIILISSIYKDLYAGNRFEERPDLEAEYREALGYIAYYIRQRGTFLKLDSLPFIIPIPNITFFLLLYT